MSGGRPIGREHRNDDGRPLAEFRKPKLEAYVARDARVNAGLSRAGWVVVRIWEHEDIGEAVARIETVLGANRGQAGATRQADTCGPTLADQALMTVTSSNVEKSAS
jgi:hypothetical protein